MIDKNVNVVLQKSNVSDLLPAELASAPDSFFTQVAVANGVLEQSDENFLNLLVSKVRMGGKIVLRGTECLEVCRRVYYGELDANNGYFKNTKNFYTVAMLKDIFSNNGWAIDFIGINDLNFNFEATRNSK